MPPNLLFEQAIPPIKQEFKLRSNDTFSVDLLPKLGANEFATMVSTPSVGSFTGKVTITGNTITIISPNGTVTITGGTGGNSGTVTFSGGVIKTTHTNTPEKVAPGDQERANSFISTLYQEADKDDEDAAMQTIYRNFYEFRKAKNVGLCDRILDATDVNRLSPPLLVAMLTITAPMKTLSKRPTFYARSKAAIVRLRGDDRANKILVGLE